MTNESTPENPSPRRSSARLAKLGDGKRAAEEDGSPIKSPEKKMKSDTIVDTLAEDVPAPDAVKEQVLDYSDAVNVVVAGADAEEIVSAVPDEKKTVSEVAAVDTVATGGDASNEPAVETVQADQAFQAIEIGPIVAETVADVSNEDKADAIPERYEDLSDGELLESDTSVTEEAVEEQKTD